MSETLKESGWGDAETLQANRWRDCQPDFETAHFLNGFGHADGRFRFAPDWAALGPNHSVMPALPDHVPLIETADAEQPFRLVTAPAHNYLNTSFTETATSIGKEARPVAKIHPSDAEVRGIRDSELVSLASRKGDITLKAKLTDRVQPGVVYTTFHNPETGANVVTTEFSDWATNCPEYKVTAVQVAPASRRSEWQKGFDEKANTWE